MAKLRPCRFFFLCTKTKFLNIFSSTWNLGQFPVCLFCCRPVDCTVDYKLNVHADTLYMQPYTVCMYVHAAIHYICIMYTPLVCTNLYTLQLICVLMYSRLAARKENLCTKKIKLLVQKFVLYMIRVYSRWLYMYQPGCFTTTHNCVQSTLKVL